MNTSADAGVMSVADVGPRLVSHSGLSFATASYRLSELVLARSSRVNTIDLPWSFPERAVAPAHPTKRQTHRSATSTGECFDTFMGRVYAISVYGRMARVLQPAGAVAVSDPIRDSGS